MFHFTVKAFNQLYIVISQNTLKVGVLSGSEEDWLTVLLRLKQLSTTLKFITKALEYKACIAICSLVMSLCSYDCLMMSLYSQ